MGYERPDNYIVKSTSYSDKAKTPVLTANKSFVLGYTDEDFGVYKNLPVIIFDDFTTDSKFVDFPFKIKSSAIKILKEKRSDVDLRFFYAKMKSVNFPTGSHKRFYISQYQNLEVLVPPFPEQQKIAEILGAVDEDIAKTQEVIEATEKLKRGLMQQLFTRGIGHTKFKETKIGQIPEEWDVLSLEDISKNLDNKRIPITKSKRSTGQYPYYGATGIVDYVSDYIFEETLLLISEDGANLKDRNYPIAFTATGKYWVNNHAHIQRFEDKFLQQYVQDYLNMLNLGPYLTGMTQPKLNKDRLFMIPIPKPKKTSEIKEIAEILSAVDKKILVNKKLKEKLTLLKKGLMQDLLSGVVRTNI
ncbi:MAG: restriction endonuclease subunit S [Candidatus Magasanikbacteria bacterium]|nr:restriction endonuclease subunit S [Candidatus Magasanikbacteria bacterium]